jgi:hydrogenase maturation factor
MHDPTEGGLATGLWELASASRVGLEIDAAAIPVFAETQALCSVLDLDPLGVIASGALLLAVDAADEDRVCRALEAEGIPVRAIGRAVTEEEGLVLREHGGTRPLPRYDQDEIARLYG